MQETLEPTINSESMVTFPDIKYASNSLENIPKQDEVFAMHESSEPLNNNACKEIEVQK